MLTLFNLKTFGGFALTAQAGGERLAIPAGKAQALLTYLALSPEPVKREWLADFLWPDLPADAGRFNLRHAFFHLRRLCGDALFLQDRQQIGIADGSLAVDVTMLIKNMHGTLDVLASEAAMEACNEVFLPAFWLPDCEEFEAWVEHTRKSLLGQQVSLLERLAEQRMGDGYPDLGIQHARRLMHLMPHDDGACRRLMRYLIDTRRTSAAVAEFDHFAAQLALEIGVKPEPATVLLAQAARTTPLFCSATAERKTVPLEREWRITTALYCERAEACAHDGASLTEQDTLEEVLPESVIAAFKEVTMAHGGIVMLAPSGGMLAYFGYPIALEHAPTAAITAGLELLDAWQDSGIQFRIGAHLGRTLCDQQRPDISNDIARVAQRICLVAEAGQFVINTDLREAQNCFHMVAMGSHAFRGLSRTFQIYRVERGALEQAAAVIVGREREQDELNAALVRVLSGASLCIGLHGEAGIGKTTLAIALRIRARQNGAFVIKMRCVANLRNTPLYPVQAWLRERFGITQTGPAVIAPLMHALGEIGCSIGAAELGLLFALPLTDGATADAEQRHQELLTGLLRLLAQMSAMVPVVIIIDDMHWIDPSTLELLDRARQMRFQRTLLLLTSRNPFDEAAPPDQCVTLMPLTPAAASSLAQHMARPGTDALRIAEWVAKADGSPFFLRELAHSEGEIPVNVHAALQVHLDQLGSARRVAQMASILGRQIRLADVAALCQLSQQDCAREFDKLVRDAILMEMPETGSHAFRHTLMQEAAYRSLVTADRQQSHLMAAQLLAASPKQCLPEQIAYHYQLAALWRPAAQYLLLAGTSCTQLGAHREALTHLTAGIKAAAQLDDADDQRQALSGRLHQACMAPLAGLHGKGGPEFHQAIVALRQSACKRTMQA